MSDTQSTQKLHKLLSVSSRNASLVENNQPVVPLEPSMTAETQQLRPFILSTSSLPSETQPSDTSNAVTRAPVVQSPKRVAQKGRRRLVVVSVACVVALLIAGSAAYIVHKLTAAPQVTLYSASMQNVAQNIGAGGVVFPNQRLDISYPFNSRVTSVLVKPGDHVTLNQPLIQLDFSQVNSANLLQLNTQVQQAYQDMLSAQTYLNSVTVVGNPVIIAQAQQAYIAAQNRYNTLSAEAAAPALHQGVLASSLVGTITAVNVYPGQVFAANRVMLTIYDESSVIVHVMVPLTNLKQIHVGQGVQVTPAALPGHNYAGKVMSIINDSDPLTDTFQVWVLVKNLNSDFVTGMSTFVQFQNNVNALVIPRLAVLNPDRDSIVYVVRSQHAYIQHVQVVGYVGDSLLIGSGLSANDMVVLVGLDGLQNGQAVSVVTTENASH